MTTIYDGLATHSRCFKKSSPSTADIYTWLRSTISSFSSSLYVWNQVSSYLIYWQLVALKKVGKAFKKYECDCKVGPIPLTSRVITPLIGVITPVTHL